MLHLHFSFCFFFFQGELINFFFFFFQAGDGIRDFHVTGVPTCALPIYRAPLATRWHRPARPLGREQAPLPTQRGRRLARPPPRGTPRGRVTPGVFENWGKDSGELGVRPGVPARSRRLTSDDDFRWSLLVHDPTRSGSQPTHRDAKWWSESRDDQLPPQTGDQDPFPTGPVSTRPLPLVGALVS